MRKSHVSHVEQCSEKATCAVILVLCIQKILKENISAIFVQKALELASHYEIILIFILERDPIFANYVEQLLPVLVIIECMKGVTWAIKEEKIWKLSLQYLQWKIRIKS